MTALTFDVANRFTDNKPPSQPFKVSAIGDMFRNTVQNHQIDGLLNATDTLAEANFPSLSMAEIQAEINDVRTQRQSRTQGYYASSTEQGMCA